MRGDGEIEQPVGRPSAIFQLFQPLLKGLEVIERANIASNIKQTAGEIPPVIRQRG
jgi:hypothetical protein